jgi:3-hydroxyisobutyrate dehydrogenase
LGNLGRAIAKRLREVFPSKVFYVWTRDTSKKELFASEINSVPLKDLGKIPDDVGLIFICLFGSDEVDFVIEKINAREKIVVDITTNHPDRTPNFAERVARSGGIYLETPVLGSVIPASQGELTMLVAGNKTAYEIVKDILSSIASKIFYLGEEIGMASKMKLINNLVLGSFMSAICEALAVGEKLGFQRELIIEVLKNGAGNSTILSAKEEKLKNNDFSPHFSVSLIKKDLDYLFDILKEKFYSDNLPFNCVRSAFGTAKLYGLSQLDFSSIYIFYKKLLEKDGLKKD